ncbi:hypothetical protein IAD21_00922 [Abditibacteriota bacterium]|nr:hypothetical protein IAD21_00922 [Abditibacteriota bacterium]
MNDRTCKLFYDTKMAPLKGHYVVSMSRRTGEPTGNAYRIIEEPRKVKSEINPNRYNLVCLRCLVKDIPSGAVRFELWWYSRNKT